MGGVSKVIGLFRGKTFTTAERLEKAIAKGRITSSELKNVQDIKNEPLRESLSFSLARFSGGGEKSRRTIGQIDDLTYKFGLCDDTVVTEEAQRILTTATANPGISRRELRKAIDKAEHLLDSVNTANGRYSRLFSDINPTGYMNPVVKQLDKIITKFLLRLRGGKIKVNTETAYYSKPRQAYIHNPQLAKAKGFKRFAKFDSLSRYTTRYKDNPELLNHLYNKHYLSQVDGETAEFLRGIDATYGTKIFLSNPLSKSQRLFIQEEFKAFKEAGLTDLPPILEINKFDPMIIKSHFEGYSIFSSNPKVGRYVKLRNGEVLAGGTMRHELIHQFDKNTSGLRRAKALFSPKAKISPAEEAQMRASGLHSGNIDYAKTETADLVAVAGQHDATKYSKEFAQRLVSLGLPEEVLQMKPVSLERHVYQSFSNIEDLKLLDEVKLVCGGKIPMELQMDLIDNPKHIKRVRSLLHLNCSTNAKKVIQRNLAWYVKGIKPQTYKDPELVKLLDLQVRGGEPAYSLYDIQAAALNSNPEALEAFKKYANVRNASGDSFLGHVFIGFENKGQINAAERLLNIQINGEFPYQSLGQIYGIKDFIFNIPPEKLSKACANIEKAAQNGEVRNLNEYLNRYIRLCHHLKRSQTSAQALTNVTHAKVLGNSANAKIFG